MLTVMCAFYYTIYGPAIQVAVLKGEGDTVLFFMDKELKKLKPYFQKRWPNNILKYVKPLHDNAHLHKAANVGILLKDDKVTDFSYPPYGPMRLLPIPLDIKYANL